MAIRHFLQSNFIGGEITPQMFTRADLDAYNNSMEKLENWLPMPHGGITTRPGLEFVGKFLSTASDNVKLMPFIYNTEQRYVVEVGDQYFRFFTDGARVVETAQVITSQVNNIGIIGHGYSTGDPVVISGFSGDWSSLNGEWVITVVSVDAFTLDGAPSVPINGTSGATICQRIVQIATPYTQAQLLTLRYAQDANNLYLAHGTHAPRQLARLTASTFSLSTFAFDGGPFQKLNTTTSHTMTPGATTGATTLTSSTAYFNANMVGMFIRVGGTTGTPAEQGYALITGYTSTTVVNITVLHTLSGTSATDSWALGSWGEHTGYPQEVALVGQRIVWGKTATEPQTAWASAVTDLFDFSVNVNDDRAFNVVAYSKEANTLQWLMAQKDLLIGTSGTEFSVVGGANGLTPVSANVRLQSAHGSNGVRPVQAGNSVLFTNRTGRKLREMSFQFEADQFVSPDLSLFARHILETNPVVSFAYQQERDGVFWFVLDDGTLATMTWLKDQKVVSWARHYVENAWIWDVVTTPNNEATHDDVYFVVERTIKGASVKYIERLSPGTFVDSNLQGVINGRTIYGLDHLEDQVVSIVGDGGVYRNQTVLSGQVTIDEDEPDITFAIVGLPITATAIPVEPEIDDGTGTSFGKKKRWVKVYVRATDTLSFVIGDEIQSDRTPEDAMDEIPDIPAVQEFDNYPLDYESKGKITLKQTLPLPATILGMFGVMELED